MVRAHLPAAERPARRIRSPRAVVVASLVAATIPAALAANATSPVITDRGVGGLTLGRTLAQVRGAGLVGRVTPGCELASPRPYGARLRAPLQGFATFSGRAATSRLVSLVVTGGAATDRQVTIGTTAAKVRRAYPKARLQNSRAGDPIEIYAIVVARARRDRIWFVLDRPGGRVQSIHIPGPEFCE